MQTTNPPLPPVPADTLEAAFAAALQDRRSAALCAPPGAGKSTRAPIWALKAPWRGDRRILVLEPRRAAARALARHMACLLGGRPGGLVGWRMRQESAISAATRLEIVTEGVLLRMLREDPALSQAACVIFDEFHERSLQADAGLALCLEARRLLRPDLRLAVMSATLDPEALAALPDFPAISGEGRCFPVETRHLPPPERPAGFDDLRPLLRHAASVILDALRSEPGGILVFLPGAREIAFVADLLAPALPADTRLFRLHGLMPSHEQDAAIAPSPPGERKVVLSTSLAETSLTLEGVRVVVDCGLSREPRWDAGTGLSGLVTRRAPLDSAAQRAGRAGRTEPGLCLRLWSREEEAGMRPRRRPEILEADLAPTLLQIAAWGARPEDLRWIDAPPAANLHAARACLRSLGALKAPDAPDSADAAESAQQGDILTDAGLRMSGLPAHPRIARMLTAAPADLRAAACLLAALLDDRPGAGAPADIRAALDGLLRRREAGAARLRAWASRLAGMIGVRGFSADAALADAADHAGVLLALAWPDRLAARTGEVDGEAHFQLRCGRAGRLPLSDPLSRSSWLVVADAGDPAARARIRLAAPLEKADVETLFAEAIRGEEEVSIDDGGRIQARMRRIIVMPEAGGTPPAPLLLDERPLPRPDGLAVALAFCDHIRRRGADALPWTEDLLRLRARVLLARGLEGAPWPDLSDAALLDSPEDWLAPTLESRSDVRRLTGDLLADALRSLLPPPLPRRLDALLPRMWRAPSGREHPVIYGDDGGPHVAVKLQECFGCRETPSLAGGRVPLTLHLLSPAGRPLQITRDLAGFWRGAYAAVRAEMRGRYPKHPWPEDPLAAPATAKTGRALRAERGD